jgi:hypothetical protein
MWKYLPNSGETAQDAAKRRGQFPTTNQKFAHLVVVKPSLPLGWQRDRSSSTVTLLNITQEEAQAFCAESGAVLSDHLFVPAGVAGNRFEETIEAHRTDDGWTFQMPEGFWPL